MQGQTVALPVRIKERLKSPSIGMNQGVEIRETGRSGTLNT